MYEYDPSEPSLGQAFANILRGFQSPQQWQEVGQGIQNTAQVIPNVAESLARGGVGQAIGTMGDLRDLRNTVQSYLPKSVQNWSNAAEFLTNPYAKALIQTAPTTEQTLETVPRITPAYEGSGQHEVLGEFIAPSLGYFGGKALKVGKNLPVGMSIEDVTPPAKIAEALRQPEKNQLGFYSALDEAVTNLPNAKGTGQQYLAQLLKTGGVKQEELATRGLDTFLESNPKVTREQIAQYLRENPVKLEETVLKEGSPRDINSMNIEEHQLRGGDAIDDYDYIRSRASDIADEYESYNPDVVQLMRENSMEELGFTPKDLENPYNEAKFQQYVNDRIYDDALEQAKAEYYDNPYRTYYDDLGYEVTGNDDVGYSITDPNGNPVSTGRSGIYDIGEVESRIREDALNQDLLHFPEDESGAKFQDYTLPNGENYREVLIQYPQKPEIVKEMSGGQGWMAQGSEGSEPIYGKTREEAIERWQNSRHAKNYQSGHFDEPNILAHFRTTDRTIDGKKTLFVEEIQSDWHQQGRKKGYNNPQALEEIKKERARLLDMKDYYNKLAMPYVQEGKDAPPEIVDGWTIATNGLQKLDEKQNALGRAVPDAPFKKNWQELAMKRAMQMAAEGGYDRVAFTTGKQQADRYSLSKQINDLKAEKIRGGTKDGQYEISATDKNGRPAIFKVVPEDELEGLIGKELAKKIVEDAPQYPDGKVYTGLDLDVGGEGMKGFYDKILPDFINKYGKKHGLKVGQTKLRTSTDKQAVEDAQLLSDLGVAENKPNAFETVHYFDLTPEAKESFLKKGQPMFAVAPALAITDEDSRREVLEKLFNSKK